MSDTFNCDRAVRLMRRMHRQEAVPETDIEKLSCHLQECPDCLADRVVIGAQVQTDDAGFIDDPMADTTADQVLFRLRERGEDSLSSTGSHASKPIIRMAGIAAAAMIALGVYLFSNEIPEDQPSTTVVSVQTTESDPMMPTKSQAPRVTEKNVGEGDADTSGDVIRSETEETAVLLPTGVRLLLAPHTTITVLPVAENELMLRLKKGRLLAAVNPRRTGPRFVVSTSKGQVTVTGTVFEVTVTPDHHRVAVLKGSVTVRHQGGKRESVEKGYMTTIGVGPAVPFSRGAENSLRQKTQRLASRSGVHTVDLRHRPPLTVDLNPPGNTQARRGAGTVRNGIKKSAPSLQMLLEEVRYHRGMRAWEETVETYQRIVALYPESRTATEANVALGDIFVKKINRPKDALVHYNRYLAQKEGILMEEALMGKAAALSKLRRPEAERAVLKTLLEDYPTSLHRDVARQRIYQIDAAQRLE